jgi:hypothetical protein
VHKIILSVLSIILVFQFETSHALQIIHMAYDGDDANGGTRASRAVRTFDRVKEIVANRMRHNEDIQILIKPGIYENVSVRWPTTLTMPNNRIFFMPYVTDGTYGSNDFVTFRRTNTSKSYFFNVYHDGTRNRNVRTNLTFFHLRVEGYFNGMVFSGRIPSEGTIDNNSIGAITHNHIIDCRFHRIGGLYFSDDQLAYKAVGFNNSDNNVLRYNHFTYVENAANESPSAIHAIYAAYNSNDNQIFYNRFERISGHPIKFRDFSNFNSVRANLFIYSGSTAMVQDWYGSTEVWRWRRRYQDTGRYECASWENEVLYNTYHKSYYNSANRVSYQRSSIPITIVLRDDEHMDCPTYSRRMRAWRSSNYQNNSPSEVRSMSSEWAPRVRTWISNNIE